MILQTKDRKIFIRSLVKPGITGLAQVSGLRGDNGNEMEIEMKKESRFILFKKLS